MSETPPDTQPQEIRHVTSSTYASIRPTGYVFAVRGEDVKVIYYHDDLRIFGETRTADGRSRYQTANVRVQDVSLEMHAEDFVKLLSSNLQALEEQNPGILERHKIKVLD